MGDDYIVGTDAGQHDSRRARQRLRRGIGRQRHDLREAGDDEVLGDWATTSSSARTASDTATGGGRLRLAPRRRRRRLVLRPHPPGRPLDGGNGLDRAYVDKFRVGFTTYLLDDLANVETGDRGRRRPAPRRNPKPRNPKSQIANPENRKSRIPP